MLTDEGAKRLDALGDGNRRMVLQVLARTGPLPVGLIAAELPIGRPAVSQHLQVLRRVGLVTCIPEGTKRYYCLNDDAKTLLTATVAELLTG